MTHIFLACFGNLDCAETSFWMRVHCLHDAAAPCRAHVIDSLSFQGFTVQLRSWLCCNHPYKAMKAAADEEGQVISVEVEPDGGPWLPADEHFEPGKQTGFVWQAVLADLPAVRCPGSGDHSGHASLSPSPCAVHLTCDPERIPQTANSCYSILLCHKGSMHTTMPHTSSLACGPAPS